MFRRKSRDQFFDEIVDIAIERSLNEPDAVQVALLRLLQSALHVARRHSLLSEARVTQLEGRLSAKRPKASLQTAHVDGRREWSSYNALGTSLLRGIMLTELETGPIHLISIELYADCIILRWMQRRGHDIPPGLSWLSVYDDLGNAYKPVTASVSSLAIAHGETVLVPAFLGRSILAIQADDGESVDVPISLDASGR